MPRKKPSVDAPVAIATPTIPALADDLPVTLRPPRRQRSAAPTVSASEVARPVVPEISSGDDLLPHIFRTRTPVAARPASPELPQVTVDELPHVFRPIGGLAPRRPESRRAAMAERPIAEPPTEERPIVLTPGGDDVLSFVFRTLSGTRSAVQPDRDETPQDRRRPAEVRTVVAPVRAEPPKPVEPPPPAYTVRPTSPQVILRNGVPTLVRDGRAFPPISLHVGASDPRRDDVAFEELRMAVDSGLRLFSFPISLVVGEPVTEAVERAKALLVRTLAVAADAQVLFRITWTPGPLWETQYPDARYRRDDGGVAEPSLSDDKFWGDARTALDAWIRGVREATEASGFLGVHLDRGEWFLGSNEGFDRSRAAERKFRDWARTRYGGDVVALRASWFESRVTFDTVAIPADDSSDGDRFVRSSRRGRKIVDYHLFLADQTVWRIDELALAAKVAGDGDVLVGVSYGYTFEFTHPSSGHLALGKLLRSEEIDYVAGPPSYADRQPGGTGAFPGAIDSFAINGKLYLSEDDYKTSLAAGFEPDDYNPAIKTPQALESVHWRGVGAALTHGAGVEWSDAHGNGWLKTASVWERARAVRDALTDRLGVPLGAPDVAVFIDERALAYLVDEQAFSLLVKNVRDSVLRAGVSAGFYLLSDLAHRDVFPESKLYVFLNAWDVRPELRSAIKNRLQRDGKVLFWLYAAGLFDAGRESLERAREVTGIPIKPQPFFSKPGTVLVQRRHPLCEAFGNRMIGGQAAMEPSYFAIPEGAVVLGEYAQTGLPSFIAKKFTGAEGDWTSVFLGEPEVTPALIRALAEMAGAHVFGHQDDVIHVRAPFLAVHCGPAGTRTVALPEKGDAYDLITRQYVETDGGRIRFMSVEGSTRLFLYGSRSEIEAILRNDRERLLQIEELPPRVANVRKEVATFDVPIMQLGVSIEENGSDDLADEWFLRTPSNPPPPPGQANEEDADRVGRRRRRRGRSGSGGSDSGDFTPPTPEVDLELNVMFRSRR